MSAAEEPAATPLAELARWAGAAPHTPWLFHPDGWDWRWRSWAQVADQVARGAMLLRRRWQGEAPRIGFDARQDPDAVAAGLAIQAAGALAVPVRGHGSAALEQARLSGCTAWLASGEEPAAASTLERFALTPALSRLDRTEPTRLDPPSDAGALVFRDRQTVAPGDLTSAALRLATRLDTTSERAIVCVAPGLDPLVFQRIQAWILHAGAAWVLEDDADAFVPTVLWARPTLVVAAAGDLDALAARLGERKHRHHRISRIAVVGEQRPEPNLWQYKAIPIIELFGRQAR